MLIPLNGSATLYEKLVTRGREILTSPLTLTVMVVSTPVNLDRSALVFFST